MAKAKASTQDPELAFDLEIIELPVKVGDRNYILREATGDVACKWRNAMLAKTVLENGKAKSVGAIADTEPLLVSMCLFRAEGKKDNVTISTIREWPARITKTLFEKIKDISDLNEEEQDSDAGKNEPSDTPDG